MINRLLNLFTKSEKPARARVDPVLHAVAAPTPAASAASMAFSSSGLREAAPHVADGHGELPAAIPLQEVAIKATPHRGPTYKHMPVPTYPTHGAAVPAAPPDMLMETQMPLIRRIHQASTLSKEDFNDYILPAIHNFAAFVHLLPASESHHHCQVGGLFRHSLEVAFYAAVKCTSQVFALSQTPLFRKEQEPRWRACAILAGLLHDIGKAIVDVGAKDESGRLVWEPNTLSLHEWLTQSRLDYYFVYWRPGPRGMRHEAFSMSKVDKIIPQQTNLWLNDFGGRVAVIAMLSAIAGDTSPTNQIFKVVDRAEQMSVGADIRASAEREAGIGDGGRRGMSARIVRAVHDLLDTGEWLLNEPTHALWVTTEGLFGVFPTVAERIAEALKSSRDLNVPTQSEAIIDYLDQAGQLAVNIQPGGQYTCTWRARIFPAEKDSQTEFPALSYVRFTRDRTIIPHRIVRPKPAYVEILDENNRVVAGGRPPWLQVPVVAPVAAVAPEPVPTRAPTMEEERAPTPPAEPEFPSPPEPLRDRHTHVSPRMEKLSNAQTVMTSKWPPVTAEEATAWLASEGSEGELLQAIADRLHQQRLSLGTHVIEHSGFIHFRFPDALADLGLDEREIVQMIERKGWLQRDPPNSARATVSLPVPNGKPITAIRLNENISKAYALLLPQTLVRPSLVPPPARTESPVPRRAALGKYIDADVASRLRGLIVADPHDGTYLRRAYWTYLQELRDAGVLEQAPSNKKLRAVLRNFQKGHPELNERCLLNHLVLAPHPVYLRDDDTKKLDVAELRLNATYSPDLEPTEVAP